MKRNCGECSVCCVIGAVPELNKQAHTPCKYIKTSKCGSCSIFDNSELPHVCKNYKCAWLRNYGNEEDRPDKNGVLFTINWLENQRYITAIEYEKTISENNMTAELSEKTNIPIIVVKKGTKPPHDDGDYVVIHDDVLHRCSKIAGKLLYRLSKSVGVYELIKGR